MRPGVRDAAEEALSALRDAQKIRRSLTGARNSVDGAREALDVDGRPGGGQPRARRVADRRRRIAPRVCSCERAGLAKLAARLPTASDREREVPRWLFPTWTA